LRTPSAEVRGYSASAATIARVSGFGFCIAPTSKNPTVDDTAGSGPVGVIVKYFG
jgi:hypothetical protein